MDRSTGLRNGQLLGIAGALATIVSPWLPWYKVSFTAAFGQAIDQEAHTVLSPAYAGIVHTATSALPPSVTLTGWHVATHSGPRTPLYLMAVGVITLVLMASNSGSMGNVAFGFITVGLAGYHILGDWHTSLPGTSVAPAYGSYVALGGGIAILAGKLWAANESAEPEVEPWSPPVAQTWSAPEADYPAAAPAIATPVFSGGARTGSVGPPGF